MSFNLIGWWYFSDDHWYVFIAWGEIISHLEFWYEGYGFPSYVIGIKIHIDRSQSVLGLTWEV